MSKTHKENPQLSANFAARLLLTAGEPSGIGPDLIVQLSQKKLRHPITVIADIDVLQARAAQLNLPFDINQNGLQYLHVPTATKVIAGELNIKNAEHVLACLKMASDLCLEKKYQGIVTGPVHKAIINQAGFAFSGHTEFFQQQAQVNEVVMMLVCDALKVALVTTHIPLDLVAKQITQEKLRSILKILFTHLPKLLGLKKLRLLVCGLNPHAGEDGHIGREEIDTIIPVLNEFRASDEIVIGPLSADTIYQQDILQQGDVVLAMYHDQGLPVIKTLSFGNAANVTIGLPYIRTSVDHGTALSLAGTGKADASSLQYAIEFAGKCLKMQNSSWS